MKLYNTPDVYIDEESKLPPSVAEVSTAVPAFVGYTEKAINADGKDVTNVPVKIDTLLEYYNIFGGPDKAKFTVNANADGAITSVTMADDKNHRLYYSLDHFFRNGGGSCYVVSVGGYTTSKSAADFTKGLEAIAKEDEVTLIILSEATTLATKKDYYDLCQSVLNQCNDLKDRFGIFDVLPKDKTGSEFRDGVTNYLKYGAAYTPHLDTSIAYQYSEADVVVSQEGVEKAAAVPRDQVFTLTTGGLKITYNGKEGDTPTVEVTAGADPLTFAVDGTKLTIQNIGTTTTGKAPSTIVTAWGTFEGAAGSNFSMEAASTTKVVAMESTAMTGGAITGAVADNTITMADIKDTKTALYNAIKLELAKNRVTLPSSPAVAGVYASVDRDRGVWKAPANVGLNAVIAPTIKISAQDQDGLNVDPTGGKSINAIRSFSGKGTLVWGARTLAGNDNEWRYVPVRRLFNMIEESAKKATSFAVFEPNDATTWLKVKGMLDSYLYGLWQQGALAGPKPEAAYFVNVGLGKTMTSQDILEGRMIISIGIAAVRPAEFIYLQFSHKMQEA